jgi:hypothetical protein
LLHYQLNNQAPICEMSPFPNLRSSKFYDLKI